MRLPNGYGSVVKLNGNRRRPYMSRKTIGYKPNKTPIYQIIGYHASKEDALRALADFNESPPITTTTFANVYLEWLKMHSKEVTSTTTSNYSSAFKHLKDLAGMPISSLKYQHFQDVLTNIRERGLSYSTAKKVRTLISLVMNHALITERINKPIAPLKIGKNSSVRPHKPFTRHAINRLWNSKHPDRHIPLILIYTGMRSIELRELKRKDVNLKQRYIRITKSKTKAGLRTIPIHSRILPLITSLCEGKHEFLLGKNHSYNQLSSAFDAVLKSINGKHTTHDCRHTFATLLDNAGVNPVAKRRLLGHAGGDVSDRIYTHKNLRELRKAVELLR